MKETAHSRLPGWVKHPYMEGYWCGIGAADPQKSNPAYQRRVAMMQAKAEIAREIEVDIRTVLEKEKPCRDEKCRGELSVRSRHRAQQLIGEATIRDEWTDPQNSRLYIRLIVKKSTGE